MLNRSFFILVVTDDLVYADAILQEILGNRTSAYEGISNIKFHNLMLFQKGHKSKLIKQVSSFLLSLFVSDGIVHAKGIFQVLVNHTSTSTFNDISNIIFYLHHMKDV